MNRLERAFLCGAFRRRVDGHLLHGGRAVGMPCGVAMFLKHYGVRVFPAGFIVHRDHWPLIQQGDGTFRLPTFKTLARGRRAVIRAFSEASRRRLEFIAANAFSQFATMITLTYHAVSESWENTGDRNVRIAKRSKRDLNRFITALRAELGEYLWVQEFQVRGVLHYHLLCTGSPSQARVTAAWCRATGELDDAAALNHAAKVEPVRTERGVRSYLGRYVGKGRQKSLPEAVSGAGRWWGRSRGLKFEVVAEVISREAKGTVRGLFEVRVLRGIRRWLRHELRFKVTGGMFVDWGGTLSARLVKVLLKLLAFYRNKALRTRIVDTTTGGGE